MKEGKRPFSFYVPRQALGGSDLFFWTPSDFKSVGTPSAF